MPKLDCKEGGGVIQYLWPNIRVDRVSCSLKDDGEQQIIMVVLALPPVKKKICKKLAKPGNYGFISTRL